MEELERLQLQSEVLVAQIKMLDSQKLLLEERHMNISARIQQLSTEQENKLPG